MSIKQTVALKMRRVMVRRDITKSELAKRMKCSPSFVTKMLSGKQNLTLKTLDKFRKATGYYLHIIYQA